MSEKPNYEPQARPPLLSVETPNAGTFQMGSGKGKIPPGTSLRGSLIFFTPAHKYRFLPMGQMQEEKPRWGSKF